MEAQRVAVILLIGIVCQASCSVLEVLRRSDSWMGLSPRVFRSSESEQCERISQALDNLWDAFPDDIQTASLAAAEAPSSYKDYLAEKYSKNAPIIGFTTPSNNINTHEGRKEIACKLAGVHNIGDFLNLFNDKVSTYSLLPQYYNQAQYILVRHRDALGMPALEDTAELVKKFLYFMRITGFPDFPLDIYDMDMASYIVKRAKSHILGWSVLGSIFYFGPRGRSDEYYAQFLMSETLHDAVVMLNDPVPTDIEPQKDSIRNALKIFIIVPQVVDLAEVLYEGGFFGPTATTG